VRKPDMDHLDYIKFLLDHGADVNARVCGSQSTAEKCVGDSTETRTNFTMQWLYEDGATPFLRAAQSGDVPLMKLLLARGADPKIATTNGDTALMVAAGIGWVEGVTYEWSGAQTLEAVKLCLDWASIPTRRMLTGEWRCMAPGTREATPWFNCWLTAARNWTRTITVAGTPSPGRCLDTPGFPWTTRKVWCGWACNPLSLIPRQRL